jgi:hypothetical protein
LPTTSALLENSIGALKDLNAEIIRVSRALENQSMENVLRPLIDSTILISQVTIKNRIDLYNCKSLAKPNDSISAE